MDRVAAASSAHGRAATVPAHPPIVRIHLRAGGWRPFVQARVRATMGVMIRKVMVGFRRDRHGEDALALARMLASSATVEEVLVVEAVPAASSAKVDARVRRAEERLESARDGWPEHVR